MASREKKRGGWKYKNSDMILLPISGNPLMVTFVKKKKIFFFSFIINLNELCKVRYILDVILH